MSVQKRGAKWLARYRDPSGRQRGKTFTRKAEAQEWEASQLARMRRGDWTDPMAARTTVQSVYEDWLSATTITERTRYEYRSVWRTCCEPYWSGFELRHATPAEVVKWCKRMQVAGQSHHRMRQAISVFNQTMQWAVGLQLLLVNPVDRAKALAGRGGLLPATPPRQPSRPLTVDEVYRLADAAGEYAPMILTMAFTGVRLGEARALTGQDVDLLRNRLLVRHAYTDVGGVAVLKDPKNHRSREVPIVETLRPVLGPLLSRVGPAGLLFTAPAGGPLDSSNWRRQVFKPAAVAAGLPEVTIKNLRQTFSTISVQAGVNVKVLQRTMGHSDIRLTLDIYAGSYEADVDTFASALSDAVSRGNVHEMCTDGRSAVGQLPHMAKSNHA